jgi:hypothetical protein
MKKVLRTSFAIILLIFSANTRIQAQIVEDVNAPTVSEFLKSNESVKDVQWKSNHFIILTLKKGKTETYNLDTPRNRKSFFKRYGSPPLPLSSSNNRLSRRVSQ